MKVYELNTQERTAVCKYCGKEFTYASNHHNERYYCSASCANRASYERRKVDGSLKTHHRKCVYCGKEFDTIYGRQKYCCRECSYKDRKNYERIRYAEVQEAKRLEKELAERRRKERQGMTLDEIVREATRLHMSYGQYVRTHNV